MHESDDQDLLAQYVRDQSEVAFAKLVARHVNMVYSVALRQVSDSHQAEDITQVVFLLLAKKAESLSPKTIVSGWLYRTAQLTAANFLRMENRRQRREQEVHLQSFTAESEPDMWEQIAPVLDVAMGHLGNRERNARRPPFFLMAKASKRWEAPWAQARMPRKRVSNGALKKLRQFFHQAGHYTFRRNAHGGSFDPLRSSAPAGLAESIIPQDNQGCHRYWPVPDPDEINPETDDMVENQNDGRGDFFNNFDRGARQPWLSQKLKRIWRVGSRPLQPPLLRHHHQIQVPCKSSEFRPRSWISKIMPIQSRTSNQVPLPAMMCLPKP